MLKESFSTVGKEYGYDDVDAEFASFKELKIKWQRSRGKAEFKVSDYLEDANREIMDDIARSLFSRISGKDPPGYPDSMNEWITSDSFLRSKQPIYIRRSRNLARTHIGEHRDLEESYQRLVDMGLAVRDENVVVTWTKEPNFRRVGYCSVIMKVVAISSVFDNDMIPEFVLDYVMHHELVHITTGFNPFGRKHGPDFRKEERKFPQWKEAEEWLRKLCLYL